MCPTLSPFVCFFFCPPYNFKRTSSQSTHRRKHTHTQKKRRENSQRKNGPDTKRKNRFKSNFWTERKFKGIEHAFEIDWRSYFFVYFMYETFKNIIRNGSILRRLNSIISILCVWPFTHLCVLLCCAWVCTISVYTHFDEFETISMGTNLLAVANDIFN